MPEGKPTSPAVEPGLVSVIVICRDAEDYVTDAIDSVLAQSYASHEVIVVDDGSKDASAQRVRAYGERVRLIDGHGRGPAVARNLGRRAARGELVAILDAYNWWDAELLTHLVAALRENPNAVLAYSGWQNVYPDGRRGRPYLPPDYERERKLERFLRATSPWPVHAALIRRSALDAASGFDERWSTGMDLDLWLRMAVKQPVVAVDRVLAYNRPAVPPGAEPWRTACNLWEIKRAFVRANPELVEDIPRRLLIQLVDGGLLQRAYTLHWQRDLASAQRVFRRVLKTSAWQLRDLRYLIPALLPAAAFQALVRLKDQMSAGRA
jgi:glycosyltransferase involved in cell wall biosynthesis